MTNTSQPSTSLLRPFTHDQLDTYQPLEWILLVGTASSGKTDNILSLARTWQLLHPGGRIKYIDLEAGAKKIWNARYSSVHNIDYYGPEEVGDINDADGFLRVFSHVWPQCGRDDWLAIESDSRIWSNAQDTGWLSVTGMTKDAYMTYRLKNNAPTTPSPDNLWQEVGDRYRRQYITVLLNEVKNRTNIIQTTGLSNAAPRRTANVDAANQLGIDLTPDGHKENYRWADTVVKLYKLNNLHYADVVKDRGKEDSSKVTFQVRSFLEDWYEATSRNY